MDEVFLNKLREIVLQNISNEDFKLKDLVREMGISRSQIHRRLRKITEKSSIQFIREIRLEEALRLLEGKVGTVSEIAYRVGFNSPSYFNKCFLKQYGITPGEVGRESIVISKKPEPKVKESGSTAPARRKLRAWYVIIVLLIVVVGILSYPKIFKKDKFENIRDTAGRISIAVMPFKNQTGDTTLNWFQGGISSLIINGLGSSSELTVRDDHTIYEVMENMDRVFTAGISPSVAKEIAKKVHAETYISGSYQGRGGKYWILANLVETESGDIIWTNKIEGDLKSSEYLNLADSLCNEIKNFLEIQALKQEANYDFREAYPNSAEAFRYYIEGMYLILEGRDLDAIESLKKANKIDTTFTLASFYLAMAYNGIDNNQCGTWIQKAYDTKDRLPQIYQNWLELWYATFVSKSIPDVRKYCYLLDKSGFDTRLFWFDLATTYTSLIKEHEKAVEAFEKIEEINKERGDWEYELFYAWYAQALHYAGKHEKEEEINELGLGLFPESGNIQRGQAICALSQGNKSKANNHIEEFISWMNGINYSEDNKELALATIYWRAGILDKAEYHYRKGYELAPQNVFIITVLARILIYYDININEGMNLIQKALEFDSEYASRLHIKGWGLYKQGKLEESIKLLKKAKKNGIMVYLELDQHIKEVEQALAKQNK